MSKFKAGDRVRVYGYLGQKHPVSASVTTVHTDELIVNIDVQIRPGVFLDGPDAVCVSVSPKQCRRLIKKPKRRVWINVKDLPGGTSGHAHYLINKPHNQPQYIEFVEVKK